MKKYNILYFIIIILYSSLIHADNLEYNLAEAITRGDIEQAKELIAQGADVNKKQEPFQQPPIIFAPLAGIEFVSLLVENGANVNARDQDNNTALMNACLYGQMEIAEYLISKGADITATNKDDLTVLEAAQISKNSNLIQLIKSKSILP